MRDSYFAGSGDATSNTKTLLLGTQLTTDPLGNTAPIAAGDLIFVIQMQDATINSNSVAAKTTVTQNGGAGTTTPSTASDYGDGTGRGSTDKRGTGHYEFAVVTAVAGNVVTVRDPLQFSYASSVADASNTRRSFQVLRVPQHSSLTLSGTVQPPVWNGATGGVLVLDVAGTLNMNSATIDASARGFRGGGSFQTNVLSGTTYNVGDYGSVPTGTNGIDSRGATKGEGYAGTPWLVRGAALAAYNGVSAGLTGGDLGYPGGVVLSRGAPGNAGGGGTQHNSGGGGGGNVGQGGTGGYSFGFYSTTQTGGCLPLTSGGTTYYSCGGDTSRPVGGLGGAGFMPDASRLISGGGGGAGDSNNGTDDAPAVPQTSGGAGGGVIFIRASTISGSGTLKADGEAGLPAGRDGSGGGGSGGTIAIATAPGSLSLTASVTGGAGGNSGLGATGLRGNETQGPGGGGGGGAVLLATGVSISGTDVSGGAAGVNTPVTGIANSYGSQAGVGGNGTLIYANGSVPLPAACVPALTVTKTTSTPDRFPTSASATYTITASNAAGRSDAQTVVLSDTSLPGNFNYASTDSITKTGGAVQTTPSSPAAGSAAPSWGTFTIPGGGSVSIQFQASLTTPALGVYQNPAQVTYLDPLRTTTAGTATATYDPASSAGEDVTVYALPHVVLEKWVRNISSNPVGTFATSATGAPKQTLEYCINYTNDGGYVANNFVLKDVIPGDSSVIADATAYSGNTDGLLHVVGGKVVGGSSAPAGGTARTSATETDARSLSQSGGLSLTTNLAAGSKGVICFQTKVN